MNRFRKIFRPGFLSGVSEEEKINFARHLAIVIKGGLPLLEGLRIISRQLRSKKMKAVVAGIGTDISNGQFLAASLERYPEVFDEFFVSIVRVGESSGTLAQNLYYLADELNRSRELRSKIRSAMLYPFIILIVTLAVVSFLVFFAFPKVVPVFASLHVPLPFTTRALIAGSQFLLNEWQWIILGLAGAAVGLNVLFSFGPPRTVLDRAKFYTPIFSRVTVNIGMANFARVLATLMKGGIKIVEALMITAQTFDNLVYRKILFGASEEIKKGGRLADYLLKSQVEFPPLVSGLLEIGENTGNLEENLEYLAAYYNEEVDSGLRNLTAVIEPLMLIVMGLIVGFVALSVITPIYLITQGVK